jgi:hypothetical protein
MELPFNTKTFNEINKYFPNVVSTIIINYITPFKISENPEEQFQVYCDAGYFEMAENILKNIQIGAIGGLSITCQFGFVDIAKIIIHKININIKINEKNTNFEQNFVRNYCYNDYKTFGFYQACSFGQYRVVKMLLENGVDDKIIIEKGIYLAKINDHNEVKELLYQFLNYKGN